jgi:hypothetical protein
MARETKNNTLPPIIAAFQKWIHDCLIGNGSIFSKTELWTQERVEEVKKAFVDHPDMGKDSFRIKLKGQMQNASPEAQQLMAEMLWVILAFPTNINQDTKRDQIRDVWSLSGEILNETHPLLTDEVLAGIGSGGQGYNNFRWMELAFLIELVGDLKKMGQSSCEKIFSNYDDFVTWIDKFPSGENRQFKHMLRYFAFPDRVERMSSNNHRYAILEKFGIATEKETRKWSDRELDDALLDLRKKFQTEYPGEILDYYEPPLRARWFAEYESGKGPSELKETAGPYSSTQLADSKKSSTDLQPVSYWWLNANPKIWNFVDTPVGQKQTYTSKNEKGNKRQKYKYFQEVKPGDLIIGYVTSPQKEVVAVCKITKSLHRSDEGEQIEFEKIEHLAKPIAYETLRDNPDLENSEPIVSNQGSLFKLTEQEYEIIRSLIDDTNIPVKIEIEPYDKKKAMKGLFLAEPQFDDMLAALNEKKNVVLQGAPGAGKTYVARRLAYALIGSNDPQRIEIIQFHQSYSYEDFIQGFRPTLKGHFDLRYGIFHQFCRRAQREEALKKPYVFIIDEINRGNLSKIFGELMMLIEADKRGKEHAIPLTYSQDADERFYIPDNLHLIGMMNTADRSLAMVDYALRRRFRFITLRSEFTSPAFQQFLAEAGVAADLTKKIVSRMTVLNEAIALDAKNLGHGYQIGHSYFCPRNGIKPDEGWYRRVIESEIVPLIQEYWFDNEQKVKEQQSALLA